MVTCRYFIGLEDIVSWRRGQEEDIRDAVIEYKATF